ncbi:UDP-N-acetylmuramoylalanine--D-glutamate ligase [Breoghania corrubedonensis]|uniref:UDP-N-acetylmuramoylalanine--D-glutamate ligase n=1 Tax=Breoghania corrubedonensis TaxID=665038 RepID=A0A2T5V504_9HYPH|nr:UDP-N-acetylmuramoyl-L-alanine--D-glutamate ligase [Breoghania corrubedonensis]PTW58810.1 UDP-N-acetylmuramoylalanine--D-glutamate ligase [Breoghania corrubedonensis]
MIEVTSFAGRSVALFGLGGSGLATARALMAGGAHVFAWDDAAPSREKAQAAGIALTDLSAADWSTFDCLVLAPGVPLTHPEPHWTVRAANDANIEIIGDLELFARERRVRPGIGGGAGNDCPFIAVTGTNGKSTTVSLITHLLKHAGRDVQLGGNIGTPVLALAPFVPGRTYVVECSSFQIDLAPGLAPDIGVLMNIAPDHLDRHGSMDNYVAIKTRLVAAGRNAVIGVDDAISAGIADQLDDGLGRVRRISATHAVEGGVYADGTVLYEVVKGEAVEVADLTGIDTLRGAHNAQNAAAAFAALRLLGLDADTIAAGLATFPGLPHRMEIVGRRGKVLFVNDSKATNADAAQRALGSFDRIYWIAGGRAKTDGIDNLTDWFPRIVHAYLIGEAAERFAATLGDAVPWTMSRTLEAALGDATRAASADTHGEPVVLLSPACASYDQYSSFEERGDAFRAAVAAIDSVVA